MQHLGTISSLGFGIALVGFVMPWLSIIKNWPFALVGWKVATGAYNIPPTEYYILAVGAASACGAVLPHVFPQQRRRQRVLLAALGLGLLGLMRLYLPEGFAEVEWRMGYYVTGVGLAVALVLNLAAISGLFKRKRRRRRRRTRHA